MYDLKDVMHETKNHFVLRVPRGYEVYRNGVTHSTRCAQIGWAGDVGLNKAKAECKKRELELGKEK